MYQFCCTVWTRAITVWLYYEAALSTVTSVSATNSPSAIAAAFIVTSTLVAPIAASSVNVTVSFALLVWDTSALVIVAEPTV